MSFDLASSSIFPTALPPPPTESARNSLDSIPSSPPPSTFNLYNPSSPTPTKRASSLGAKPKSPQSRRKPKLQMSKHSSCQGCRAHKTKCSRTPNCESCRQRGDICVWSGATPARPAGSDEFPEASTRAQREIARLRALVTVLAAKAGVDPDDPTIQMAAASLPPTTFPPTLNSGYSSYRQETPSTPSASSESHDSSSDFGPMSVENSSSEQSEEDESAAPIIEISRSQSTPVAVLEDVKKIHISTDTQKMLTGDGHGMFESPHSVTPTSFRFSYREQAGSFYEQSSEARAFWPGLGSPRNEVPTAHVWD